MKFRIGELIKFKNFDQMEYDYKMGNAAIFHKRHQNRVSKVINVDSEGKLKIDLDKEDRFHFRPARFVKYNILNIDDDLFQI